MSQDPKFSIELHALCGKLRDGDITQADAQRLNQMLRESRVARRFYRTFMALTSALESRTTLQEAVDQEADSDQNIEVLIELLQQEQAAEVVALPTVPMATESALTQSPEQSLGWHKVGDALSYLLSHAVKSTPAKWAAVAAIAVLAATLFVVMKDNPDVPESRSPVVATPDAPTRIGPAVASLTGEHNAVWDRRPGQDLYAGQRFHLAQGFAQITTHRGAVAILEAPASIELSHNDNAIRLNAGKLVGICETQSSKGFVVSTPHMDITDLGTRFGVDLTGDQQTAVHVIEGEVSLAHQTLDGQSILDERLSAGQAATYGPSAGLAQIDFDAGLFVADMREASLRPDFARSNAVWLGQLTGDLSQNKRRADALQVFLEQRDLLLKRKISVDFNRENPWDPSLVETRYDVASGQRVDVYLLHFDLLSGHQQPENFVLDFDRPIVGVIISQYTLNETDDTLGVAGVTYPFFKTMPEVLMGGQRGLNFRADGTKEELASIEHTNDLATISADGTRLNLRLWGGEDPARAKMDQVRVLVRSLNAHESP